MSLSLHQHRSVSLKRHNYTCMACGNGIRRDERKRNDVDSASRDEKKAEPRAKKSSVKGRRRQQSTKLRKYKEWREIMWILYMRFKYIFYTLWFNAAFYIYTSRRRVKPFTLKTMEEIYFAIAHSTYPPNTRKTNEREEKKTNGQKPDTIAALHDAEPFTGTPFSLSLSFNSR